MKDNTVNETTSPIDAANGVAQLSGFSRNRCESNITATKTKSTPRRRKTKDRLIFSLLKWLNCKKSIIYSFSHSPNTKHDDVAVNIDDATNNME